MASHLTRRSHFPFESLSVAQKDLGLLEENTLLIKSLAGELSELRDYNQSLSDQIGPLQLDSAQKQSELSSMKIEREVLLEENLAFRLIFRQSEIEFAIEKITDKAFLALLEKEQTSSAKLKASHSSLFLESINKNNRESILSFKKSLMNSTKKKQKGSVSSFGAKAQTSNLSSRPELESLEQNAQSLPIPQQSLVFAKISKELISKANEGQANFYGSNKNSLSLANEENFKTEVKQNTSSQRAPLFLSSNELQSLGKAETSKSKISTNLALSVKNAKNALNSANEEIIEKLVKNADFEDKIKINNFGNKIKGQFLISEDKQSITEEKKSANNSFVNRFGKDYSESEKFLKEDLGQIKLGGSLAQQLGWPAKELTLREMVFVSDPKIAEIKSLTVLRIKEEVNIEDFQIFGKLKSAFQKLLINKFNTQENLFGAFENALEQDANVFFFAFGGPQTGKTFTLQGLRQKPGLLPSIIKRLAFDKEQISLQLFDAKENFVDDLIKQNALKFTELFVKPAENGLFEVKVGSESALHKVFKAVFSQRMNKKDAGQFNCVVRLIVGRKKSLTFIDTCTLCKENARNLEFLAPIIAADQKVLAKPKGNIHRLLFGSLLAGEKTTRAVFNLIGHINSIENLEEVSQLISLMEA